MLEHVIELPLENATEIHNDFCGVDFWCAIFCTEGSDRRREGLRQIRPGPRRPARRCGRSIIIIIIIITSVIIDNYTTATTTTNNNDNNSS